MSVASIVAGVFTLLAYVPYILSIVRRKTVPSRVSWWIWSVNGLLLLLTYQDLGSGVALGLAVAAFLGQILIALFSLRYGKGGATPVDGVCLIGACVAALLWFVLSSAAIPHLMILAVDFFAWFPTFRKSLQRPQSEDLSAWLLWTAGAGIALLSGLQTGGWDVPYPLYATVTDGIVLLILLMAAVRRTRGA